MKTMVRRVGAVSVVLAASMAATAHAADAPAALVQGQGIAITTDDVLGDALRMPENLRAEVLSRPQMVKQMASNLYVYRSIAQKAQAQGLDKQPRIAAALKVAHDKVLADAWLAALDDKTRPSAKAAEAQARTIYQAEPQRFKTEEEVHARHILVAGTDEQARAKAQELLKQLQGGADFAELAQKESADKGSAARGGDLGFFPRGKMVPSFEKAAFGLTKSGELSDLVESQFGFHIIRLEEKRPAGVRPFEEVRDALVEDINNKVTQKARADEAAKLREHGTANEQAMEAFADQQKALLKK